MSRNPVLLSAPVRTPMGAFCGGQGIPLALEML